MSVKSFSRTQIFNSFSRAFVLFTGIFLVSFGFAVSWGWYNHNLWLLKIFPTVTPMNFTPAVCFSLVGISLISSAFKWKRCLLAFSVLTGVIGVEILAEFYGYFSLGINDYFLKNYSLSGVTSQVQTPTSAGILFIFTSLALILSIFKSNKMSVLTSILGSIIIAGGVITLVGYWTGVEVLYDWGFITRMSVYSAFCFILLGLAIALLPRPLSNPYLFIVIVISLGLTLSLFSFGILKNLGEKSSASDFKLKSAQLFSLFNKELQINLEVLQALQAFYGASKEVEEAEFKIFTTALVPSHSGINFVAWLPLVRDSERDTFLFRYLQPSEKFSHLLDVDVTSDPVNAKIIQIARGSGQLVALSHAAYLSPDENKIGPLIVLPIYPHEGRERNFLWLHNNIQGLLICQLDLPRIFDNVRSYFNVDGVDFSIIDQTESRLKKEIFQSSSSAQKGQFSYSENVFIAGRKWQLIATSTPQLINDKASASAYNVLIVGLLLTVLISYYLISSINRTRLIKEEVDRQTLEIAQTNTVLKREIAERMKTEHALLESQQLLKSIIDNTTAVIYIKEYLNSRGTYLLVNKQFEKIFNLRQPIGKTDYDVFPKEFADKFREMDLRVFQTGKTIELEEAAPHDDGVHTYVSIKVPLINQDGRIYAVCGISTDITERKRIEERNRELADKKLEFVSMVSHELRAPLQVIVAGVDVVHDGMAGPLEPKQKDLLVTIKRNVDRLTRLINDVLEYQKLEAGRLEFHLAPHDVNTIVQTVTGDFMNLAVNKGLTLRSVLVPGKITVNCDHDKIVQVLVNLINNAIKFTEKGEIVVGISIEDKFVRVSVKDQGRGIKPQDMAKLFQSFSQIHDPQNPSQSGTGLGLAISKKIVEAHGGKMGVASVYGQGSTFSFTLPA